MPASLQSPGVSVSIIDESFYTPAAPGTVPLIFVASAQDKTNPSGSVAKGTTAANAGTIYNITSQRDLLDTFGTPQFYTDASGNPIHGGELNEYGLQAAYSLLGASSAAYIVRAPLDLSQLKASASEPTGNPADGAYWVNTANTLFGVFEWDDSTGTFTNKVPAILNDDNALTTTVDGEGLVPKASIGKIGTYVVVVTSANNNAIWYKNSDANWVKVGTVAETNFSSNSNIANFVSTTWSTSWPTVKGTSSASVGVSGNVQINGVSVAISPGPLSDASKAINNHMHTHGVGSKIVGGKLYLYADTNAMSDGSTADGNIIITAGGVESALGLEAGTYYGPTVFVGPHTQYPNFSGKASGSIYMKTTSPNNGASWLVKSYSASTNQFSTVKSPIYSSIASATYNLDRTGGGANIAVGTLFIQSNYDGGDNSHDSDPDLSKPVYANFQIKRRAKVSPTTITTAVPGSTITFGTGTIYISATAAGSSAWSGAATISIAGGSSMEDFVTSINAAEVDHVSATLNANGSVSITHDLGGDIKILDGDNILGQAGYTAGTTAYLYAGGDFETDTYYASNWVPLTYTASANSLTSEPANGQLWYNSILDEVDILYHNGSIWQGYGVAFPDTDPAGPIVASSQPTTQSTGAALANGDIWIVGTPETYGQEIYVYNGSTLKWVLQDPTDNTGPNGWLFMDARWGTAGTDTDAASIAALRETNYVDPDAPDPAEYPRGMRLWNLRRSGFNVKKYVKNYININANDGKNIRYNDEAMDGSGFTTPYNPNRWISVSPNKATGAGNFGRHAQRSFIVKTLKATIDGNLNARDTATYNFNLISCPGYSETIQNMISLNADRSYTGFVIGDTPMRLEPTGTALQSYGLNSGGSVDNDDAGAVSYDTYGCMAMFYPSGYTSDLAGNYIMVPPSHMMLRTIALSDQKSYPWFAPAGVRRGVVDNVTSVGYLKNGEFVPTALPTSIRDVMAQKGKINPIATFTGAGIINFGQYTRFASSSSLDRINVARLVAYLRRQLDVLSRPYLFEPNDKITRGEIKNAVQSLLLELVGQRALYDFIVVCDDSNNTPARIDRSELWIDVAIEPVKAVEFIYIPVRLVNTGDIKAGQFSFK